MKTIPRREFREKADQAMGEVEAGEAFCITRGGVEVAEISPITTRRGHSAQELVKRYRFLPRIIPGPMRGEAEEFFGD